MCIIVNIQIYYKAIGDMDNTNEDIGFPFGFSITDANAIFHMVLESSQMANLRAENLEGESVEDLCDPNGWLAPWMREGDEISMILFNKKLWDVQYRASSETLKGFMVETSSDTQAVNGWMRLADLPWSLRFLIAKAALTGTLEMKRGRVWMREAEMLMGKMEKDIEEGDALEDAGVDELFTSHFMKFLERARGVKMPERRRTLSADPSE